MMERFSVSVSVATIVGVLAKLGVLYHMDRLQGHDWLMGPVNQIILGYVLLAVFLIFFRGKMMHDDAVYFADLSDPDKFRNGKPWRFLVKFGLLLGYVSWLLWAPAIYFLDDFPRFSVFLIASLGVSTVWLVIDRLTRIERDWRRLFWLIPNGFYIGFLALLLFIPSWASRAACLLLLVLIIDWLVSDPFSGVVKRQNPPPAPGCRSSAKQAES